MTKLKTEKRKIRSAVFAAIAVVFLIFVIWFRMNYTFSYVPTESMEPYIMSRSLVLYENHPSHYDIGDIAIYDRGDIYVIHRIVDITEDGQYIFKGDNNAQEDTSPVSSSQLKGKYLWHSETIGKYYRSLMMLLYVPIILEICCLIFRYAKKAKKKRNMN